MKFTTHNSSIVGLIIMAAMIIMSACSTGSKNWPQFRGPDANMIVDGAYLPTEWSG